MGKYKSTQMLVLVISLVGVPGLEGIGGLLKVGAKAFRWCLMRKQKLAKLSSVDVTWPYL
jgi:hypothetical protein